MAMRKGRSVFSHWADRLMAVLVRKVSGPHIEKSRNCLEKDERVGENWW